VTRRPSPPKPNATTDQRAIGAGLAPAREARPIRPGERIHVVGAAGAGASAAAFLGHAAGALVTGCDPGGPSPYTPALEGSGIALAWRHDPAHVTTSPAPDRLAVTKALTAIAPDHPELEAARHAAIPIEPWQQVVADAAFGRRLIAVAGTHGKSTSAGWLVHVLVAAGADPSAFVGALLPAGDSGGSPATARWGGGATFVVEADEYAGNFDPYHPSIAVVTSAEWDHPDVFPDRAAVVATFARWLRGARPAPDGTVPTVVANVADAGVGELAAGLTDWPGRLVAAAVVDVKTQRLGSFARGISDRYSTALGPATPLLGRIVATAPTSTSLEIHGLEGAVGHLTVELPTAGRHNAANALGVAGAAAAARVAAGAIATGLATFAGVGRRLERKGEARDIAVYDDYGHHPTAIRQTIAAIRQREPGRRIWAVYEPLTYHRTAALLDDFAAALAEADAVAIADIWAGRDRDTTVATPGGLADAVRRRKPGLTAVAPGSVEATAAWLANQVRPGDAVLVMGGGRSYRIGELLLEELTAE
jgi:UDP-N-acetylmuramate--alanine ligase